MAGIDPNLKLRLVQNTDDIAEFLRWLSEDANRDRLGFDTETSGLSPERDRIRLMQFGDKRMGWAFSWEDWRGLAKQVFQTYTGDMTGHNVKFDVRHLCDDFGWEVAQWPWHRTHDGMAMAHINDSQASKALKSLTDRLIDPRASAGQRALDEGMKRHGWDWGTVPIDFPPYWQYGALDPVLSCYIDDALYESTPKDLYDLEMGAIRVAARMEQTGIRVSRSYSRDKADELDEFVTQSKQWLRDVWGIERPTPMQLIKFFNSHGVDLPDVQTNSGTQSMTADVLKMVDHDVARAVLGIRKAEKMSGTYLHNLIKFSDEDGIIHPGINTMAARTGRMSITEPALQTLPRRDPTVRDAFIPREGHAFLTIDADQIEARLTAHFSGDEGLANAFASPDDFFCVVATQAFGYPVTKGMTERDLIKGVVYGKVYGASVKTMAATAGVAESQMRATNSAFDAAYPRVGQFMGEVVHEGKRRGYEAEDKRGFVNTPYGRKLKADKGKEYALVNYLIQCHASEILKRKLVELDNVLPDEAKMILPVHDEIVFDVPIDIYDDVLHVAQDTLNQSEGYKVPITWGADRYEPGAPWGSKYRK